MSGVFSLNFRISAEFRQISLSQLSSVCSESGWKWVSLAVRIEMATVKTPNSILFKCKMILQNYNSMALNIWTVQVQILFLPIEYFMQTPGIEAQTVSDKISWVLQKLCFVVSVKPKKLIPMVCYTKHPRPSETPNSFGPSVFFPQKIVDARHRKTNHSSPMVLWNMVNIPLYLYVSWLICHKYRLNFQF